MGCMHNPRKDKFEFLEETIKNGAQIDPNEEFAKQLNEFKNEYPKWEQSTHDRFDCNFFIKLANVSKAADNEKTFKSLAAKFEGIIKKLDELIPKEPKYEVKLKKTTLKNQVERIVNEIKSEELEKDNSHSVSKTKA